MHLTKEEKKLISIMVELNITPETIVSLNLLLRKKEVGASTLIESLKKLKPQEINDEKIIEIALNL